MAGERQSNDPGEAGERQPPFTIEHRDVVYGDPVYLFSSQQINDAWRLLWKIRHRPQYRSDDAQTKRDQAVETLIELAKMADKLTSEEIEDDDTPQKDEAENAWIKVAETALHLPSGLVLKANLTYIPQELLDPRKFYAPYIRKNNYQSAMDPDFAAGEVLFRMMKAPFALLFEIPDRIPGMYLGYALDFPEVTTQALGLIRIGQDGGIASEGIYSPPPKLGEETDRLVLLPYQPEKRLTGIQITIQSLEDIARPIAPEPNSLN